MKKNIALLISILALILCLIFLRVNIEKVYTGPKGEFINDYLYGYNLKTNGSSVNGLTTEDEEIYYLLMEIVNEEEGIYNYELNKLNIYENKITTINHLDNIKSYCSIKEENIYCHTSNNFTVYDLNLNETFTYTFKEESLTANYLPYKDIYIKVDNKNIDLIRNNNEELYRTIDFEGILLYEDYFITDNNSYVIFLDDTGNFYLYDVNENKLTNTEKRDYFKYDKGIFFYNEQSIDLYNLVENKFTEYENYMQEDYYYSGTYHNNIFYLYDIIENILYFENLETNTLQQLDMSNLNINSLSKYMFSNHYLYIYALQEGNNLFVLDLEKLDLPTTNLEEYKNQLVNNINNKIKNIKDKYNVNINIKENAIITFPDFSAKLLTNDELILTSLNKMEVILNKYDLEFFNSFYDNGYNGLNLYLTGSLTPSDYETQAANPAAYSLVYNNKYMIVIDLNQPNIEELLCHELLHNLEFNLNNNSIMPFGEWNTYNPENYYYNLSYTGSYDYSNTLTEEDANNVYFIDPYSKTYPTEDRARVFEKVCSCESNSIVNEYPHLYQKSLYLEEEITKYYPSLATTGLFDSLN